MTRFRPPRAETFGSGKRKWTIQVRALEPSAFEAAWIDHFPMDPDPLHSFWCDCHHTIWLRASRMAGPEGRIDFMHELDHAYIDWRGRNHEQ